MHLATDFNNFDGELVTASIARAPFVPDGALEPGEPVELYDEDGVSCLATVVEFSRPIVWCRPDPTSWTIPTITMPGFIGAGVPATRYSGSLVVSTGGIAMAIKGSSTENPISDAVRAICGNT